MLAQSRMVTTLSIISLALLFSACTSGVTGAASLSNSRLNVANQVSAAVVSSFPQCSNDGSLIDYDNTVGISYIVDSCLVRNGLVFRVRRTFITNGNPNYAPYVHNDQGKPAILWEWIGEVPVPPVEALDITITSPPDQGVIERTKQNIVFSFEDGLGVMESWIAININGTDIPALCNVQDATASCLPSDALQAGEYTAVVTVTAPSGVADSEQVTYRILDLPPDPGEAGKATLLGIDSDSDGVRDDIQRYIELTYPDSAKTRAALRQNAKAMNDALESANDKRASIKNAYKVNHAQECLFFIFREAEGTSDNAYKVGDLIDARILNTEDRTSAYLDYDAQLGGEVFSTTPLKFQHRSCDFDLSALPD